MMHKTYTGNDAIARGYQIYDEWKREKYSSRDVADFAKGTLDLLYAGGTERTRLEVLACIFALDLRIKETYQTFLRRLFSFLSWRREIQVFKSLKEALGIQATERNIRAAIEIELQQLRSTRKAKDAEDDDDEIYGGRQAEAEEQTVTAEANMQEQTVQEKTAQEQTAQEKTAQEEAPDEAFQSSDTEKSKYAPEENAGELAEHVQAKEQIASESHDQRETADPKWEKTENTAQDGKEKTESKQKAEPKDRGNQNEEKNGTDTKVEPSADKKTEPKTYNDAFDVPPLFKEMLEKRSDTEKRSFIDEVIMDNMIKGKEDYLTHNPLEDVKREREMRELAQALARENGEGKNADKGAHLYNQMVNEGKGGGSQKVQVPVVENGGNLVEQAPDDRIDPKELEELRALLQSDIFHETDNEKRIESSNNMSEEEVAKIYQAQVAAMREQLELASAEYGIQEPVKIIGKPEPKPTDKTVVISNKP